ncbi:MAG TPA: DUF2071 domain-containing protein [Candidatus Limnocylindria bacterium]|nr:DUF2071 domain-containing protein [Candidatus Limnocylindria bacterium]
MLTVEAELEHLAIISWPVEARKLAAMLPRPLVPQTIDRRNEWALVSMTLMRDTTVGSTYPQLNERAYVMRRDGTGKGAFFWRSYAATRQALFVRSLLGFPEFVADLALDVRGASYVFRRNGRIVAKLDLGRSGRIPPEYRDLDMDRAARVSSNPMIGYTLNWGVLCATRVRHNRVKPRRVRVMRVDPSFMIPTVAIEPTARRVPFLALYQRRTPFWIDLPPRPIAVGSRARAG